MKTYTTITKWELAELDGKWVRVNKGDNSTFEWELYVDCKWWVNVVSNDRQWIGSWGSKEWFKYSYCIYNNDRDELFYSNYEFSSITLLYEVNSKIQKIDRHSYSTTYTRNDWRTFTRDTIDWKNIEDLKAEEKELYKKAREIRWLLNAHSNLKF